MKYLRWISITAALLLAYAFALMSNFVWGELWWFVFMWAGLTCLGTACTWIKEGPSDKLNKTT